MRAEYLAGAGRRVPALAGVAALVVGLAYAAFAQHAIAPTVGAVLGLEVLAVCIFRPRPALLAFAGFWGVAHVLLSGGEVEGGGSTSISQLVGVTVIAGFGTAVVRLQARHRSEPIPFALRAFTLFAVLFTLAEVLSPLQKQGLSDLVKLVGGLVLALLAYYVIDRERPLLSLAGMVEIAGVLVALVGLAQFATGSSLGLAASNSASSGVYRATSLSGSANGTADFLLVCAGFILLRYTIRRDRCKPRADLIALAIVAAGIVTTFTRSDIIALAVMLVAWAALWQVRSISAIGVRTRLVLAAVVCVIGVVQVVGSSTLLPRLEGRVHPNSQAKVLNGREEIWSNELHKLQTASFDRILVGGGAHTSYTSVYVPQSEAFREFPPHDLLLWLIVETGVIGLVVYLSALVSLGRSFVVTARRRRYELGGRVAAVAFATTIAFVVNALFHNTQLSTGSEWYFMLFVGAALRCIRLS